MEIGRKQRDRNDEIIEKNSINYRIIISVCYYITTNSLPFF